MLQRFNPSESNTFNSSFLRRYARHMLHAAHSDRTSVALPVLRRIHAMEIVPAVSRLSDLYRDRDSLQLKHMFRTLARELGYTAWDECKRDVDRRSLEVLDRYRMDMGAFGDFHRIWFSNENAAHQWQRENGGRVIVYGSQAAVITR